jgi:Flp pilus assembly pilin Flp
MDEHVSRFIPELWCRIRTERGATMVEYALLLALIAVALLGALHFFSDSRTNVWARIGSSLS